VEKPHGEAGKFHRFLSFHEAEISLIALASASRALGPSPRVNAQTP